MSKIKIYHFHNGSGGGVLSVIKNLLRFSSNNNFENHIIHAVNKKLYPKLIIEPIEGALTQQVFYYSPKNNFYYTCKQLVKLIPDKQAIIIAHDWMELGMVSNLGLQNKVIQILHGNYDYYYNLAIKHQNIIDAYICISPVIFKNVQNKLPNKKDNIFYINFPVSNVEKKNKTTKQFNIFYAVGNLIDNNKQFKTVIEIAKIICKNQSNFLFTIAGGGVTELEFYKIWPSQLKSNVDFKGFITNEEILKILCQQDVFLLPSIAEGFPVSLIEAMKAGVVPLVTNWDSAVDELVIDGYTGYYVEIGDADKYASLIKNLYDDKELLASMSKRCISISKKLFNPWQNTRGFENFFIKISAEKTIKKKSNKVYGSRLDQRWIPNFLTRLFRHSSGNIC